MITPEFYSDFVRSLCKSGEEIQQSITLESAALIQMSARIFEHAGTCLSTMDHSFNSPLTAHRNHMLIGIAGEAGELLDAVKKYAIYLKPLDRENVVEELGDINFYIRGYSQDRHGFFLLQNVFNEIQADMVAICELLDITEQEILSHNVKKLGKRYNGKYSDVAAQLRADK